MAGTRNLHLIEPREISAALGLPVGVLFVIGGSVEKLYHPTRVASLPKGKVRQLDVPKPILKILLKKLHRFLQRRGLHSNSAHGGVAGRSSFTSASRHLGQHAVAIRDVSDCYPSVSREQFRLRLLSLGFRSDTALLLTGLMTCRDRIPQGAPTSGDALNLFLWELDDRVALAGGPTVSYTRMADDHVISGPDGDLVQRVVQGLEADLASHGLKVNEKKRAKNGFTLSCNPQLVHSIGVNHPTRTAIPRSRRKEYLAYGDHYVRAARSVAANTLVAVATIRQRLVGYLNYCRQADISPARELGRLIAVGDRLVESRLRHEKVAHSSKWWVMHGNLRRPQVYAELWQKRLATKSQNSTARGAGVQTCAPQSIRADAQLASAS